MYQPFRSIEHPSMHRLIQFLNPKQKDTDILKQTCMGEAVMKAVGHLDEIDAQLVSVHMNQSVLFHLMHYRQLLHVLLMSLMVGPQSEDGCFSPSPFSTFTHLQKTNTIGL